MAERGGQIWAGTNGGGINIIDPDTDNITILSHIPGDSSTLPALSIKSLHIDHSGNIWAGSIRRGLISISRSSMKTYTDVHVGLKHGLSNPTILNLYQDRWNDNIWIGTDGEGINKFDPNTNSFTHYPNSLKTKVTSIAEYSQSELLLSLFADNLYIFNKQSGSLTPLDIHNDELRYKIKYTERSVNVINEQSGNLILLHNTIHRFHQATGSCTTITNPERKYADGYYYAIGVSHDGLWLHDEHNIYLLPNGADRLLTVSRAPYKAKINSGNINTDGLIWLATENGLCRFSPSKKEFEDINSPLTSQASSLVCDNNSRVWIGTEKHLYAYNIKSGNFAMFGESDGAAPNEYLPKSRLLATTGDVYMGGVQGLLYISHDFVILPSEEPKLSVLDIVVDGETLLPENNGRYILPRVCHNMIINATVEVKDIFRKKIFRFESSDGSIKVTTDRPLLKISQIPTPGKYEIYVSCSKRNGEWSTPIKLVNFTVLQHWYLSWWFILIIQEKKQSLV